MANVTIVVEIYGEDFGLDKNFSISGILTLTINGTPINLSCNNDWWYTTDLVYEEGVSLVMAVTSNPKYYCDAEKIITATEGTERIEIELCNPTIESEWLVGIRPCSLGLPISFVDEVPLVLTPTHILDKIDEINVDSLMTIDEIFIPDGSWHVYVTA